MFLRSPLDLLNNVLSTWWKENKWNILVFCKVKIPVLYTFADLTHWLYHCIVAVSIHAKHTCVTAFGICKLDTLVLSVYASWTQFFHWYKCTSLSKSSSYNKYISLPKFWGFLHINSLKSCCKNRTVRTEKKLRSNTKGYIIAFGEQLTIFSCKSTSLF